MRNLVSSYKFILVFLFILSLPTSKILAQSTFVKYPTNPIFTKSNSSWDTSAVHSPTVVYINGIYKMWYEGNGGSGWRIGYAYSQDGITNWERHPQPVLQVGSSDGYELDTLNPYVIFNSDLNLYQMWYSSYSINWPSGPDRFRLRYATSTDGINWNRHENFVLTGSPNPNDWDSGGIARGISIIYADNLYKMWYTGTDWGTNWKVGYATSPDGINWTKQNNGSPVITPTYPYELSKVNFPNVEFDNGIYRMIYGASPGDLPTRFVYATSIDGILWTKLPNENPILSIGNMGSFDSIVISGSSLAHINNNTSYLWYGGNAESIGLAIRTDTLIPTPTVTPSSTPTPSPSPTTTPTPTPAPPSPKKIIIIPGLGGSWNRDALLNCSSTSVDSDWTQSINYYSDLRDRLKLDGLETYIFAYDWRRPIPENGLKLKEFIDVRTAPDEKVYVVGHSMGGLVARSYLVHEADQNRIEKLLTVGTPHNGATVAYPALAGGEHWSDDIVMKIPFTLMLYTCLHYKKATNAQTIRTKIPSFYDLLPVYDYLIDIRDGDPIPYATQFFKNIWIPQAQFEFPFFGVHVGALSGIGSQTHKSYLTIPPSGINRLFNIWTDGYPVKINKDLSGDGTVLLTSAYLPGAENWSIEANHGELVTGSMGIQDISEFFTQAQFAPLRRAVKSSQHNMEQQQTHTTALAVVSDSGLFSVKTPFGDILSDTDGLVLLENPADGKYEIHIVPTNEKTTIYVGQLVEEGKTIWKDYVHKKKNRITLPVHFDHNHPRQDPFND